MKEDNVEINSLKDFTFKADWEKSETKLYKRRKSGKKTSAKTKKVKESFVRDYNLKYTLSHQVSEALKQKLRDSGITWLINDLIDEIRTQQAYEITVTLKDDKRVFFKVSTNSDIYAKEDEAVESIIYGKETKIKLIQKEIKKLDSKFDHVLIYEKTGEIFPPKSSNYFINLVDSYIFTNKLSIQKENFIVALKQSQEVEHLENIKSKIATENEFSINSSKYKSLDALITDIRNNNSLKLINKTNKYKFAAKKIKKYAEQLQIRNTLSDIDNKILNKDLFRIIEIISKKSNFHLSSINNKKYICAYKPSRKEQNSLSKKSQLIMKICSETTENSVNQILKQSKSLSLSQTTLLSEIKWLLKSGLLRQFTSGKLEVNRLNKN